MAVCRSPKPCGRGSSPRARAIRAHSVPMESNALQIHALAHILLGKPRKSDVSDLPLMRRYRVNPISMSTFPGYALNLDVHDSDLSCVSIVAAAQAAPRG